RLNNSSAEIVVVEQGLAACVCRERIQRILRSLETRNRRHRRLSVKRADTSRRLSRCVSQRRKRNETARIDGIESDVGANSSIDCASQLRLIIRAVQAQPARKVDQRLLLTYRPQHVDRCLKRSKLAVVVEDIELAAVLPKCTADVCTGVVVVRINQF